MQLEDHPCGLRVYHADRDVASPGTGLSSGGEAGPLWLLLTRFFGFQMVQHGGRSAAAGRRRQSGRDTGIGTDAKSIQNVVPAPTSLSKPI